MPTLNQAGGYGNSDLGWGFAEVVTRDRVLGVPLVVDITCKSCKTRMRFRVQYPGGSITSAFRHSDDCPVYLGIHEHTTRELDGRH